MKLSPAVRNRFFALTDLVGGAGALFLAYSMRFESFQWPALHTEVFYRFLPVALGLRFLIFLRAGLYRRLWRHAGLAELERIISASLTAGAVLFVLGVWVLPALGLLSVRLPMSVAALDAVLVPAIVAVPRFLSRWFATRAFFRLSAPGRRVAIVGAGSAGELITRELQANPDLGIIPVGFVDDDSAKHGHEMCGLKVLGPVDRLGALRESHRLDEVIIAMPSAPGTAVREAVRKAAAAGLPAKTVPGMFEILSGRVKVASLRPIQIDDLLRREPVRISFDRVAEVVGDQVVLVTGAGGSIGSELCRQVAALRPSTLVLLGHGENSIFTITQELTERFPSVSIIPVIADVRERDRIFRVFDEHRPAVVFHAASHKHVPLMELNVAEAVNNNVVGTWNVAEAAVEFGTERFVMISTDKAVRPTSVMGASKRAAEMAVQHLAQQHDRNFISVRFGNVLGSRGSVVPIFLKQIEAGGPITITHPEMRRYFMTIPEAVQLVLEAAVLGEGGEVFVLDMGEPVRIVDLASDLIRLSGLEVGRDIEIKFTGVRPGEKLYEELFFGREHAEPTEHSKVLRAKHAELPAGIAAKIAQLAAGAEAGMSDENIRASFRMLVPDYQPEGSGHRVVTTREWSAPRVREAAPEA